MARRALAGLLGALLGLLPLVVVDAVVNSPTLMGSLTPTTDQAALMSLTAVVGGLLLGGGAAGWIAGRKAGISAAAAAGVVTALLYASALIGAILLGGARGQQGLPYVQLHPVRSSAVVLLVASVMIVVALLAGWIVRPAPQAPAAMRPAYPDRPPAPRYAAPNSTPGAPGAWPAPARPSQPMSAPRPRQSQSAPRYPR
jgi:hypothetical protein